MATPATFVRRYAAYSLDAAAVAVIAVPLLAWQLGPVPAAFDAAVAALQARMSVLFDATVSAPAGPFELAAGWADDPELRAGVAVLADVVLDAVVVGLLTLVLVAAVWFVGFEASAAQATPGKAALGLRVTDTAGARPAFGRVAGRFLAGAPSWFLLHLGHAMAAWNAERRALHDLVAGTRVVQDVPPGTPLPAWARAWLAAQGLAVVALTAWVVVTFAALLFGVAGAG